jgi:hypothetical protein
MVEAGVSGHDKLMEGGVKSKFTICSKGVRIHINAFYFEVFYHVTETANLPLTMRNGLPMVYPYHGSLPLYHLSRPVEEG